MTYSPSAFLTVCQYFAKSYPNLACTSFEPLMKERVARTFAVLVLRESESGVSFVDGPLQVTPPLNVVSFLCSNHKSPFRSSATYKPWTASLQRTTPQSSSQYPSIFSTLLCSPGLLAENILKGWPDSTAELFPICSYMQIGGDRKVRTKFEFKMRRTLDYILDLRKWCLHLQNWASYYYTVH